MEIQVWIRRKLSVKSVFKFRNHRVLASVLILAVCLAMAFPSVRADAGTSVKAQAQQPVKEFYKYAKTLNYSKMLKYTANSASTRSIYSDRQLRQLDSIFKKENKKLFTYKIQSTTLSKDKKTASVKVAVSHRSLYNAAYYGAYSAYKKLIKYYLTRNQMPADSTISGWVISDFKKGIKKYPSYATREIVTVKTRKYKSGWKIVNVSDAMLNTCICNFNKAAKKAKSDIF